MDGLIFGIIDNGIMIFFAIIGWKFDIILPKRFQRGLGALVGAGIGNAISDLLAGFGECNFRFGLGTFIGCMIPLIIIIIYYKIRR